MKDNLDTRLYNEFGFEFTESMTVFEAIIKANDLNIQMTIDETAKYLNLSRDTVVKRIKHGKIKATSHGKQKRILKAQFHDN
jgi:excisionase family DNA binding protein|tara:strand:- start:229 stop:474 length:246 start_codon:yes stop_codon:yes gene_type:complete